MRVSCVGSILTKQFTDQYSSEVSPPLVPAIRVCCSVTIGVRREHWTMAEQADIARRGKARRSEARRGEAYGCLWIMNGKSLRAGRIFLNVFLRPNWNKNPITFFCPFFHQWKFKEWVDLFFCSTLGYVIYSFNTVGYVTTLLTCDQFLLQSNSNTPAQHASIASPGRCSGTKSLTVLFQSFLYSFY